MHVYFRDVALKTPLLWNKIEFWTINESTGQRPASIDESTIGLNELCVERSGNHPLEILINFESDIRSGIARHLQTVLPFLVLHIHRWKSFQVWLANDDWQQRTQLLKNLNTLPPAPKLENLVLRCSRGIWDNDESLIKTPPGLGDALLTSSFPNLKRLEVKRTSIMWDSLRFIHLTSLELSFIEHRLHYTLAQLRCILASSPHLEHVALRRAFPCLSAKEPAVDSLTIGSLRSLRLCNFNSAVAFRRCVGLIRAPNLKSLAIQQLDRGQYQDVLMSLGASPGDGGYNAVTQLHIGHISFSRTSLPQIYFDFFRLFLHVTHLSIACDWSQSYYEALSGSNIEATNDRTDANVTPLPDLKVLQTSDLYVDDHFLQLLRARKDNGYPIDTVLLNEQSMFEDKDEFLPSVKDSITGHVDLFNTWQYDVWSEAREWKAGAK